MSPAAVTTVAAVAGLTVLAASAEVVDRSTRTFAEEGRVLAIRASGGAIAIVAWDRPEFELTVVRRLPDGVSADLLPVTFAEDEHHVELRALQVQGRVDPALQTEIEARVPATATLNAIELADGSLTLTGLRGSLQARVRRGDIVGRTLAGIVRLETASGNITLTDAELSNEGLLRCRTFDGNVAVGLTRRPDNARVIALTMSGRIESTLPLEERPGFRQRMREGVFGDGQRLLSVDVVRGDISITAPP